MIGVNSAQALNRMESQATLCVSGPVNPMSRKAMDLYRQAKCPSLFARLRSALSHRPRRLLRLSDLEASATVLGRHYAGIQPVPIRHIRGSEGRCEDFDADFRPLCSHTQGRWLSVARAWFQDVTLPAVELVQAGDVYYVRDGHHRISVARAFGQEHIDAQVTVWQLAPRPDPRPALAIQTAPHPA